MLTVEAPNILLTFPNTWEEVTLKQFLAIHAKRIETEGQPTVYLLKDILQALASDVGMLKQLGAYEEAKLNQKLPFLSDFPDFINLPLPETIAGIKPPDEIGACTLLQKWSVEELIEDWEEEGKPTDFISMSVPVLAIYLYPICTNKPLTDVEQINEIIEKIQAFPVKEALSLSAFFLDKLQSPIPSGEVHYSESSPNLRQKMWLIRWFQSFSMTRIRNWRSFRVSAKKSH